MGDLTPRVARSQPIGSKNLSRVVPDVTCHVGESLGLLTECRQPSFELGG